MLTFPQTLWDALKRHVEASYPREACGLLLGELHAGGEQQVRAVLPATNAWPTAADQHHRYLIAPDDYLRADRLATAQGWEVIGAYHSHPDHPAYPSAFDREQAWPGIIYLIISVQAGAAAEARAWRLREARDGFDEEAISLRDDAA
jgi:proteasome lid subunit RPN8/RPN11